MIKQTKHIINVLLCEVEQTINNSCSDHLIHRVTLQELQEINEQQIPQTISSTDLQIEDLKYLYQTEEALCEHLELMQFVKHKRENKQHRNHKGINRKQKTKSKNHKKQQQRHKNRKKVLRNLN